MIPGCTIYAYQMRISNIDEKTRGVIINAFNQCRQEDQAIIAEAQQHPERELELIDRIKASQAKLTEAAKGSGFSPQKYGPEMARVEKVEEFESRGFTISASDYALLKRTDPMPALLASINLRPDQRAAFNRIRAEARKDARAIWEEWKAVSRRSDHHLTSLLWQKEMEAAGVRAVEKFRKLLDKDQLEEWNRSVAAAAMSQNHGEPPKQN
jgi:hypothetical protein